MRRGPPFQDFTDSELEFMNLLKAEHRRLPAGADLFRQGEAPTHIFTLFSGWAYRYRLLSDGRRQVLGVVLPGDLVGVPGAAFGRQAHSLRTVTAAEFCALSLTRLPELLREQDGLAMRLLWLVSNEQRMLERLVVTMGRCAADESLAAFVLDLHARLARRNMLEADGRAFAFPLGQAEVADHLGVTIVHLNRTLRRLEARGLLVIRRGRVEILDYQGLETLSCLQEPLMETLQPFL